MLIRHAAIYMASNVVSAALGFGSAAIFTRLFTPGDYGVYLVANSIGGILAATLFTWVRLSVLRMEAQSHDADVRATALGGYAVSAALLVGVLPVLAFGFHLPWQESVGACLFAVTIAFFEMQLEMLRAKQRVSRYALGAGVRAAMMLALGVTFHALGFGGFGLSLSIALAYLVGSGVLASGVWKRPISGFDRTVAIQMLAFGLPATLSGLAIALHAATDRLAVSYFLGRDIAGQYGVAADLTRQLILVPAVALGSAIAPAAVRAFAVDGPEAARRHLAMSGELMIVLLLPAVAGLSLVGGDLAMVVLGEKFRDTAGLLIPLLSFVWLFQALTQNYVHVSFHMTAKSKGMLLQAIVSLAANFALVVPLTLLFGILGAASAVLAAEFIGLVAGFWFARSNFPLPLDPGRLLRVVLATAVMAGAVVLVGRALPAAGLAALTTKVAVGAATYALASFGFNVADVRQRIVEHRRQRREAKLAT